MAGSLCNRPKREGAPQPSTVGREALGEGAADSQSCGPWLTPGPLTGSQGYLPWPAPAPEVPFTPEGLHIISSQPLPQFPQALELKNTSISNQKVMKLCMKILRIID